MTTASDLVPSPLEVPPDQRGESSLPLRYEDITQDGRLVCRAMTHALGPTLWEKVLATHAYAAPLRADGIVPILSRLSAISFAGPIAFGPRPRTHGGFALLHASDAQGRARFRMDMSVQIEGMVGRTHGPKPEGAGTAITLGRVHAEHVLTRPFGAPEQRRVAALPAGVVPSGEIAWRDAEASLALPAGAQWTSDDFVRDTEIKVLGLGHTDSNQHVNSLVYPHALEEAALRIASRPSRARFAHHFELAYRKPFFAGESMAIEHRTYARDDAFGVIARFVDAASGEARTYGRLELIA